MESVLKKEKEIQDLSEDFLPFYKNISSGYNQLSFEGENFDLILIIGDIADVIQSFHAKIDAWFLDGFSPSKNPEMWTKEIFSFMKKNSKKGASLSTYTTAGFVREGLIEAGFQIEKVTGFGNKKHMLKGIIPIIQQTISFRPWFRIPRFTSESKEAVIIGAGLAGTSLAFALSRKGFKTTIIERENRISSGASGNPEGMFAPLLSGETSDLSEWNSAAYKEFAQFLSVHKTKLQGVFRQIGVFQTANSEEEMIRFKKAVQNLNIDSSEAILADKGYPFKGIFFPKAGSASPFHLSQTYLKLAGGSVKQILSSSLLSIKREESHWKLTLSNGEVLESDTVIFANSFDAKDFVDGLGKMKKVRGQILYYPSQDFPEKLDSVLLHEDGYIVPNVNGVHIIGSTFDPFDSSLELSIEDNIHMLQKLKTLFPKINPEDGRGMQGRVGFRAMSSDHLPMVGPIPDRIEFEKDYSDLWKANMFKDYPNGKYLPGLYVSCAHGSKGILSSYLAANVIASMLTNEPMPIETKLIDKINPSRFTIQSFVTTSKKSFSSK
jgi:tRNA 5-methylaminomethyl-2-thiouridine biosynthesis bifunctional protein